MLSESISATMVGDAKLRERLVELRAQAVGVRRQQEGMPARLHEGDAGRLAALRRAPLRIRASARRLRGAARCRGRGLAASFDALAGCVRPALDQEKALFEQKFAIDGGRKPVVEEDRQVHAVRKAEALEMPAHRFGERDDDVWVALAKAVQQRHSENRRSAGCESNGHGTCQHAGMGAHHRLRGIDLAQDQLRVRIECAPRVGRSDALGGADEELRSQLAFEARELLAQRRLHDVQHLRCARHPPRSTTAVK